MLKIKLLTAATAAALFAIGGAVAQTSTPGTSAGAADRAPTATTGRPEVGGPKTGAERAKSGSSSSSSAGSTSSRAATPTFAQIDKNNDGQISRDEWNAYQRSGTAASGATTDVTGGAKRGPTARSGKPEVGGPRTGGEKQGSASGGASSSTSPSTGATTSPSTGATSPSTGSTSSSTGTATSPTAPTGEPRVGGSGSTK
jgi:hypothetical protein